MPEKKVAVGDTLTIKVKVTRVVWSDALDDQMVTILVAGQPNTVLLRFLDVVNRVRE